MKTKCFACDEQVVIGSGHYMKCEMRKKMDEINKTYPLLSMNTIKQMAKESKK